MLCSDELVRECGVLGLTDVVPPEAEKYNLDATKKTCPRVDRHAFSRRARRAPGAQSNAPSVQCYYPCPAVPDQRGQWRIWIPRGERGAASGGHDQPVPHARRRATTVCPVLCGAKAAAVLIGCSSRSAVLMDVSVGYQDPTDQCRREYMHARTQPKHGAAIRVCTECAKRRCLSQAGSSCSSKDDVHGVFFFSISVYFSSE
jgi:hypothetical protein